MRAAVRVVLVGLCGVAVLPTAAAQEAVQYGSISGRVTAARAPPSPGRT